MRATLTFNGDKVRRTFNHLIVPGTIEQHYIDSDVVIELEDGRKIDVPYSTVCHACDRDLEDTFGDRLMFNRVYAANQLVGYPMRVCVECSFFILVVFDQYPIEYVPAAIRDILTSGYQPKMLKQYL